MKKIIIAGLGPGSPEDMTPAVMEAVKEADIVVGYKYYFQFIKPFIKPECECIDTGMKKERERAEMAFQAGRAGKYCCRHLKWRRWYLRYGPTHLRNAAKSCSQRFPR